MKTYKELMDRKTFDERFDYLKEEGKVGEITHGGLRSNHQELMRTKKYRSFRDKVIIRDNGCEFGLENREIKGPIHVHHINPITTEQVYSDDDCIYDLENAICVSAKTHRAIHYGNKESLSEEYKPRKPGDTMLW